VGGAVLHISNYIYNSIKTCILVVLYSLSSMRACVWWQLIETWKKLVLVGFFCLLKPGSVLQVISASVVSAIFSLLVSIAAPYKDASDDYFARACSFALTMLFFFVTVLKMGVLAEQLDSVMTDELRYRFSFDAGLVSAGMVASIVGILPFAAVLAAHRLLHATQIGEVARCTRVDSAAAESINLSLRSLSSRSTRRSVTRGEHPSQERRCSGPMDSGRALGTKATDLNLKGVLNLRMSRTHRNLVARNSAAVHATNAPYRQGRPLAAAPLSSRHVAKQRQLVLEELLSGTRSLSSSSASSPRFRGTSTTHDDDRAVRV
jgi:hypothetical protein